MEVLVLAQNIQPGPVGILHFAQGGKPDDRRQLPQAALEGLQLHRRAEGLQAFLVGRRGLRHPTVHRVVMGRRVSRQIGLEIEPERLLQQFRMVVGRGPIVAVIHPQNRNIRLHLGDQMQEHGLVRPEIGGDHRPTARLGQGPPDDFQRRLGT